ncbi:MAG: R3H domain-containing nucleic acid-binding protein, partial [Microcystaceae cyanobacterium]
QLVGTAHGNRLENLIKNPTLSDLVGGIQAVTLGDEEARRRGSQKTVLERKAPPTFAIAVEMLERQKWVIHPEVAHTIDVLLRGKQPSLQIRSVTETGEIEVTEEQPQIPVSINSVPSNDLSSIPRPTGLRASGRMLPLNPLQESISTKDFEQLLSQALPQPEPEDQPRYPGPNGEELPVYVYPYALGRSQIEQVIEVLNLPVVLTNDLQSADAILALRSQVKTHSKLRQVAKGRHIPIYGVKSNTIPQISRALQRVLGQDDPHLAESTDLRLFSRGGSDDDLEALEEARLAVEQIVIPTGQPVELLPRSGKVRKMQHELVEHYRLHSDSFGEEPNRRLRIYPA